MERVLSIDDMLERYPGSSRNSWAQKRCDGTGPAFLKLGRKIYYTFEDVKAWEAENKHTATPKEGTNA